MKKSHIVLAALLAATMISSPALAKKKKKATTTTSPTTRESVASTESSEARSLDSLHKQAARITASLNIDDAEKAKRVEEIIFEHALAVRDWHNSHSASTHPATTEETVLGKTPPARQAVIDQGLPKAAHDAFLNGLAVELTPAQVDKVKDALTINKVEVTYAAYLEIVPDMTDAEKAKVLAELQQARDDSIDVKSMEGTSIIFKFYKNKIKAFLKADGHDVDQDYKTWGAAQKKKAASSTQPAVDIN